MRSMVIGLALCGLWSLAAGCVCDSPGNTSNKPPTGTNNDDPTSTEVTALWFDCTEGDCRELMEGIRIETPRSLRIELSLPPRTSVSSSFIVGDTSLAEGEGLIMTVLDPNKHPIGNTELLVRAVVNGETFEFTRLVFLDGCPTLEDPDRVGDGVDQNCDGIDGVDADRDGVASLESGGEDCDDTLSYIKDCGAEPGDPSLLDYDDPATVTTDVIVETDPEIGSDLDGDDLPDNALGPLFDDLFAVLSIDMNPYLQEKIAAREFLLGLSWAPEDSSAPLTFFDLRDANPAEPDNGQYLISPESFVEGSVTPTSRFETLQVDEEGRFEANADLIIVPFPFGEARLKIVLTQVRLDGLVEGGEAGVGLQGGRLTGIVPIEALIDAFNGYLTSDDCSCLGLEGPPIDLSEGIGPQACNTAYDDSACRSIDQDSCATIAGACILLVPILAGQTDIDTDGDGLTDAFSALIYLEGEPASLLGVAETP